MLQQSGMSPYQQQSVGGMPIPASKWEGINKVAQTALGAWGQMRTDRQEGELEDQRQSQMQEWITSMPQNRNEQLAWALRGQEFGDTGQAVGNSVLAQALSQQDPIEKVGGNLYNRETGEWIQPPQQGGQFEKVGNALYDPETGEWIQPPEDSSPPGINKVTPSDYTPQSLAEFARTRNFNDLERYEAGRTTDIGGVPHAFDPVTMKWYPAAVEGGPRDQPLGGTPETPATQPVTAESVAQTSSKIAEAEERAKVTGRESAEQLVNWGKTADKYQQLESQWGLVDTKLDEALSETSKWTTGVPGTLMSYLPGSDARDYYETLQTIKANLGFDKLQQMRDASPTGGALGQVSEMENKLLQAVNSSLEQGQSAEQMRSNLQTIKQQLADLRAAKREAFMRDQQQFGPAQPEAPAAPEGAPQPGTVMDGYRFKGGDPSKPENWERI